ncbi:MAG TPA: osmotically inducible protein OsmC [Flavobacteriaceae bacterium]|nr:MAG: Uncharacterised protein [Flavobacteriaceae bacterium]HCQ23973.1 osmotically inducible protein OsmC [Flavobacteriaceae bacterium]|tara:strand:- start:3190 stop:3591 length:402 start_codon:yes stop_codon:yes gene_type:complete
MTSSIIYEGQLRSRCTHLQSQRSILNDAPLDNHGKGQSFSPTDLVATALGSCMLTIMGIKAESLGISLEGTKVEVKKTMGDAPRRIVQIDIWLHFLQSWDSKTRTLLERAAATCPVHHSLHPDIQKNIHFGWP